MRAKTEEAPLLEGLPPPESVSKDLEAQLLALEFGAKESEPSDAGGPKTPLTTTKAIGLPPTPAPVGFKESASSKPKYTDEQGLTLAVRSA